MPEQLALKLSRMAAMTDRERLRAAYEHSPRLKKLVSFEEAIASELTKQCLVATARSMQQIEEGEHG